MKIAGITLLALGVLLLIGALAMDTSVTVGSGDSLSGFGVSEVTNLERLQRQLLLVLVALATSLAGTIFLAAGTLADRLAPPQPDEAEAVAPAAAADGPEAAVPAQPAPPPGGLAQLALAGAPIALLVAVVAYVVLA